MQVLVQGPSRKDAAQLTGRTDANERVVFPDVPVPAADTTAQLFADMATWAAQVRPDPSLGPYPIPHVDPAVEFQPGDRLMPIAAGQLRVCNVRSSTHNHLCAQAGFFLP